MIELAATQGVSPQRSLILGAVILLAGANLMWRNRRALKATLRGEVSTIPTTLTPARRRVLIGCGWVLMGCGVLMLFVGVVSAVGTS